MVSSRPVRPQLAQTPSTATSGTTMAHQPPVPLSRWTTSSPTSPTSASQTSLSQAPTTARTWVPLSGRSRARRVPRTLLPRVPFRLSPSARPIVRWTIATSPIQPTSTPTSPSFRETSSMPSSTLRLRGSLSCLSATAPMSTTPSWAPTGLLFQSFRLG